MRRFYSPPESFADGRVTLSQKETRHLRDVLRLRVGERVSVFDGLGREFEADIEAISKGSSTLKVHREIDATFRESPLRLTLAAAMLKSDKFDLLVQKAVELGVVRLVPLETKRSESHPRDAAKKIERWNKIGLDAAKQCGRATLMRIDDPVRFTEFIDRVENTAFLFSERGGGGIPDVSPKKEITAFIGPEGGWDDAELEIARYRGFELITLGGRILRAETAAISVAAILQHRYGDVN
jgi:16S rRNA (uracil1498-N3)-methyltransferase